jgi:hypothetical protein
MSAIPQATHTDIDRKPAMSPKWPAMKPAAAMPMDASAYERREILHAIFAEWAVAGFSSLK